MGTGDGLSDTLPLGTIEAKRVPSIKDGLELGISNTPMQSEPSIQQSVQQGQEISSQSADN